MMPTGKMFSTRLPNYEVKGQRPWPPEFEQACIHVGNTLPLCIHACSMKNYFLLSERSFGNTSLA